MRPSPILEARPISGVGIGLRSSHTRAILAELPPIPWLEVLTDNYLCEGGPLLAGLDRIRQRYPVVLHGVGMSLGSTDPLDLEYLARIRRLAERIEPAWISDHLSWSHAGGRHTHDLLPLPRTEEAMLHVAGRIRQVQDFLGRRILIENASAYLEWAESRLDEAGFVRAVAEEADCEILLDVNNVHVSARNLGFDPREFLEAIPVERVRQMHLAGYEDRGTHLLDTHGEPVHAPVWELFERALRRFGPVPTLLEWDTNLPELAVLLEEAAEAEGRMRKVWGDGSG